MKRTTGGLLLLTTALAAAFCFALVPNAAAQGDSIPRAEHPRPDMERAEWLNLNGVWEFLETDDNDAQFLGDEAYPDKIVVPFCRESKLSGLQRKGFVTNVWYRRSFAVPENWRAERVLLHIGACDWRTRVWVNGEFVGTHTGGSAPFACEVTAAVRPGENRVVIHAFDDTRSNLQACGKQSHKENSYGCVYTRTTGIWQTVWLEAVGGTYVRQLTVLPDPDHARVLLQIELDGLSQGIRVKAEALAEGAPSGEGGSVGEAVTPANWRNCFLVLDLSLKHLWSVKDPFLYDLELTLDREGEVVDHVKSYFGLRSVTIEGGAILINGEPVFQRTVLDQGFYPDGIWTAPSDTALKGDIELSQAVGFNGARLHQKVFEPRFLYWADTLGYLVWGEYPNWGMDYRNPAVDEPVLSEWTELVERDRNHPAIVGWCPINEGPRPAPQLQRALVALTKSLDPTRPILEVSGYHHSLLHPEVLDTHDYDQEPASFAAKWGKDAAPSDQIPLRYRGGAPAGPHGESEGIRYRAIAEVRTPVPFFVSEYGGIGWATEEGWGYGNDPKSLDEFYARYEALTNALLDNPRMFGFCYTQLTDIEQEKNGVYFYDRTPKFDVERLHKINARQAAYEKNPPCKLEPAAEASVGWRVLVGAVPDGDMCQPWRYVIEKAPAKDWAAPDFDDSAWKPGAPGFGKKGRWEDRIGTPWSGKDIWLRQAFDYDGVEFDTAMLVTHHDNAAEVYVNGTKVWEKDGWNNDYEGFDVTEGVRQALKPGTCTIAVHCHQDDGGQFIDAALLLGTKR